jgi:outer membrane protein TolC
MDMREVRARVAADVQRAYLQALYADRVLELQVQNLSLASERLRQVQELESAGRAARYDVLRATVERANIEPSLIQARSDRELALLDLRRLLALPPSQAIVLVTRMAPERVREFAATVDTMAGDRPALRAAELTVTVRQQAVTIARADLLPTVSFFLQSGYQAFPPPGFGFPVRRGTATSAFCGDEATPGRVCQNGGWFSDRSLGATVSWPVFDGFRTRGNIAVARAQLRVAETQLEQQRQVVEIEGARARAELARARAIFDARLQTSQQAAEAFQLASLRFSRGLTTQLEVSDAQFAMLTAQSGEARAVYDLYLATVELARALGRPIPTPPGS